MNYLDVMSLCEGRRLRSDPTFGGRCRVCGKKVGSYWSGPYTNTFLIHVHRVRGYVCVGSHRSRVGAPIPVVA